VGEVVLSVGKTVGVPVSMASVEAELVSSALMSRVTGSASRAPVGAYSARCVSVSRAA